MNNYEQFKKDFKRDLLVKIVVSLKHGKTTKKRSKTLAKQILSIFSETEAAAAFAKINRLSEHHPEILDIFIERGYEFDSREKEAKLNQIILYLKMKGGETN
jgi:hypothetical protein